MIGTLGLSIILIGLGAMVIYSSVVVVEESEDKLLFISGSYKSDLSTGVNIVPPIISDVKEVDTRVREVSVPNITEVSGDGKRLNVKISVYCQVVDSEKLLRTVDNYDEKVWKVTKSEVSTVIAESEAESIRRNQRTVEDEIQKEVENVVSEWGVRVDRIDIMDLSVTERN